MRSRLMKNPCHPGEIIREDVLIPLGLNREGPWRHAAGAFEQSEWTDFLARRNGAPRREGVRAEDGASYADAARLRSRTSPRPRGCG